MEIPGSYPEIQYSSCGGICAAWNPEKKTLLIGKHNYLMREVDTLPHTEKGNWRCCFRLEKRYIRAALYKEEGHAREVHVCVDLTNDCWDIKIGCVPLCSDSSTSEDGLVFVQQIPTSIGVKYVFDGNVSHTIEAECNDTVPNEPLFCLSAPSGKYCYLKLLHKLYLPKTREFMSMPFNGYLEWMDDIHDVVCVETLVGFRELWHREGTKWVLFRRLTSKHYVNKLPVR